MKNTRKEIKQIILECIKEIENNSNKKEQSNSVK